MHAGMSGHILIHDSGNRLHSYDVLEFSAGHDAFYSPMIVDLTQPRHTVHYSCCHFGEIKFIYLVVTEPVHCCLVFRIPGTFLTNHFDHFYHAPYDVFLPRDAVHPRYWPWACVCLFVSLSVTSRCSVETAERIELVFGMWASFHPSYTVLKGNSVISKNKGTSLWYFVLNSGLRKFRHGISIVETCYQLSSRKVDAQSVIDWAVVGQLSR